MQLTKFQLLTLWKWYVVRIVSGYMTEWTITAAEVIGGLFVYVKIAIAAMEKGKKMDVKEKLVKLLDTNCGYVDEVKAEEPSIFRILAWHKWLKSDQSGGSNIELH